MRAIWTGSLSFGLISIPVKVYSAAEDRALKFHMLEKHGHCPIAYMRVCRGTNKEVPYEDIVKGYEYQKGDYVILSDQDFEKAAPKKTKTIDVESFTDESGVPVTLVERPYFIEPDEKAEKAYVLLREALKRAKKVGIARVVFRSKEHLAMIKPEGAALMLIQLRFADELRKPEGLSLPGKANFSKKEIEMALSLIEQLEEHFRASAHKDTYAAALKKVIAAKAKGKTVHVEGEKLTPTTDMRDLMEALRKSLEKEKKEKKGRSKQTARV